MRIWTEAERLKKIETSRAWRLANPERMVASILRYKSQLPVMLSNSAHAAARRRGSKDRVKARDIVIPNVCPVLGHKIDLKATSLLRPWSPSIAWINPQCGYLQDNIAIVSRTALYRENATKLKDYLKTLRLA